MKELETAAMNCDRSGRAGKTVPGAAEKWTARSACLRRGYGRQGVRALPVE
jgi:hypothetical protein